MKKLNPIAKCVLSLSCIVFVCGIILITANKFLAVSDEERLGRSLNKLMTNSGAEIFYDSDSTQVSNFNSTVPSRERINGSVVRVYKIKDDTGVNDGKFVIEAQGFGYQSSSTSLIAFNTNGTVYKIAVKSFGATENLSSSINVSSVSQKIEQISAQNAQAGNLAEKIDSSTFGGTGATRTIEGMLSATNIASLFYKEVIIGVVPVERDNVEVVENQTKLNRLNGLMSIDGQTISTFYEFPYIKVDAQKVAGIGSGHANNSAEIVAVYMTFDQQLILQVEGKGYSQDGNANGNWQTLMLMDSSNLIKAVYMISTSATPEDSGDVDYTPIGQHLNSAYLTTQLAGKSAEYFVGSSNPIFMTEATESNNGIKVSAYFALTNAQSLKSQATQVLSEFMQEEGE